MKYDINLTGFKTKGHVESEYRDNMLYVTTHRAIPTQRFDREFLSINSYIYLPDKYRLPLRIDITAKIDAPGLYVLLGNGHVNFGTLCTDNRRIDDIVSPTRKVIYFHNDIPMNQFAHITLIYDLKKMQILVDGEERYYSANEKYMKSKAFREANEEGFELKIACDKLVNLCIKSVAITEYSDTCGILHTDKGLPAPKTRNEAISRNDKPTFERCISLLPPIIKEEILGIDEYLRALRPLKFKRQVDKNGSKITYVASDHGVSYALYLSNDIFDHSLQWYLITQGPPDTWHRKADMMEETLNRLYDRSPDFAERMFHNLDDCVGCYKGCLARTVYGFRGKKKAVCHGKLKFEMNPSGFRDVRTFADMINSILMENQ